MWKCWTKMWKFPPPRYLGSPHPWTRPDVHVAHHTPPPPSTENIVYGKSEAWPNNITTLPPKVISEARKLVKEQFSPPPIFFVTLTVRTTRSEMQCGKESERKIYIDLNSLSNCRRPPNKINNFFRRILVSTSLFWSVVDMAHNPEY